MSNAVTGEDVKSLRTRMGLSQGEFAALLATSQVTVSNWERGRYTPTGMYAKELRRLIVKQDRREARAYQRQAV